MNHQLIYTKTPTGDEAVRQSTRVVQRNLRMVLVQVDGKLTVGELANKIGNLRLVENALKELEADGLIAPTTTETAWTRDEISPSGKNEQVSALSQFSTFGAKPADSGGGAPAGRAENYSSFGKPILPPSKRADSGSYEASHHEEDRTASDTSRRSGTGASWFLKGLFALLIAFAALVLLFPYDNFKPRLEVSAAHFLGVPVKIGKVSLTFSPQAQLRLESLSVGGDTASTIKTVTVASPHRLLLGGPVEIGDVAVYEGVFAASLLADLPMFDASKVAADGAPWIRRIQLDGCQIALSNVAIKDIKGEILLNKGGLVEKAALQAFERAIKFDLTPSASGIAVKIESTIWKPSGATFAFESLQAKGLLQRDKLLIQDVDTSFLGGILKGNWLLNWSNGLAMAGDATFSRIDTRRLATAFAPAMKLEGELAGSLRLRGSGADWEGMWGNLEANLNADVSRGTISGVDLGEAARRGQGAIVRAGSTRFDRLRANVAINRSQVMARDVLLESGMMSATGQFAAGSGRQVDGNMNVAIKTSVSSFLVPVRVSGVLPDLTAFGGK